MTTKTITMKTDEKGAHDEELVAGETYVMEAASADHWLKRDKATLVSDDTKNPTSKRVAPLRAEKVDAKAAAAAEAEAKAKADADAKAAKKQAEADKARAANTAAAADKSKATVETPADGGATAGKPTEQK